MVNTMENRLSLHEVLCDILGSRNVYFQPPENIKMNYPAIIYSREGIDSTHADDMKYLHNHRYQIMVVGTDPDTDLIDKMLEIQRCRYDRHYIADNLHHDVFTLYYK